MATREAFAAKMLADIASDSTIDSADRIQAAQALTQLGQEDLTPKWYQVPTRDLSVFFLKCVVAGAPAMLLTMFLYIFVAIFTQVAPSILGF